MDQPTTQRLDRQRLDATSPMDLDALKPAEQPAGAPAGQPGEAVLVTVRGPNTGARFRLDEDVTIAGRHPESGILLDDVTVSRRHAEFQQTPDGYTVADLGSLNGTYVNRERIESAQLADRDEIQIGKFRLIFHAAAD